MKMPTFRSYADRAMLDENVTGIRPVIEKELLHYDILLALSQEGILHKLCFQGGTALRLCHGGIRYSEDLDFSGGPDFTEEKAGDIVGAIQNHIGSHYDLPVTVKPPKVNKPTGMDPVKVSTWSIRVETDPGQRNMPSQRIKIDIDTTLAHTRENLQPRLNYDFLPAGFGDLIIPTQSRQEIMSNKLVALPSSMSQDGRPRYRDIWDLRWLGRQNISADIDMIKSKADEHGIPSIEIMLEEAVTRIDEVIASAEFQGEMSRFLPRDVRQQTMERPEWIESLSASTALLLKETLERLKGPKGSGGTDYDY